MNIPFFLARRVIIPRKMNFINIIAIASMLGIVIGSAALVIVMSLFNGFRTLAQSMMVGFGPHVQVSQYVKPSNDAGVKQIHIVESKLVVELNGHTAVSNAYGVDDADLQNIQALENATVIGTCVLKSGGNVQPVVVAPGVANELQASIGDTVRIYSPAMIEAAIMTMTKPSGVQVVIAGVFQSNTTSDVDNTRIYTNATLVKKLSRGRDHAITQYFLQNTDRTNAFAEHLRAKLPNAQVQTWEDINRSVVDTMKLERLGTFIVLSLIILVAAFNIVVSLSLSVAERRRDFAVLKSIGLADNMIYRTVFLQGMLIGVLSVATGLIIGTLIVQGQITFGWISFDTSAGYLVPVLPMELHSFDIFSVAVVGIVLSSLAALPAAKRAASIIVAEAVRLD